VIRATHAVACTFAAHCDSFRISKQSSPGEARDRLNLISGIFLLQVNYLA